ncbi:MAG TPA: YebC/PmpR family DNA-binding transcriptional regulator [Clostridiales bacterium UBA8153]|nr:YebC/PmpR family DNA-binding transcriptional regulator [Clostridiales bacterium UBA8153]
MAGHSKWANIKRRKAKVDAQKGNLFSKLLREVMVAARQGGGNPEANFRLKLAMQKARDGNVPGDGIARAIRKGTGEGEGAGIDEVTYEAYGPGGAAILVEAFTDNRNRTAGELRYLLTRHGGSMVEAGSVSWMFKRRGFLQVDRKKYPLSEDAMLALVLESGAEDMETDEESFTVLTAPDGLVAVEHSLERGGLRAETSEIAMVPVTYLQVTGEPAAILLRLLEVLDGHDDVQKVHCNVMLQP